MSAIPVVASFDGYKWVKRPGTDDGLAVTYFHEPFMVPWIQKFVTRDSVFVDVGSHVGRYAVRVANLVRVIYALEPNPDLFEGLLMNLQLNGIANVIPLSIAASDRKEVIQAPWMGKEFEFQADRLDSILPERPNLVLIDVEGAEEKVLRGMERFLDPPNAPTLIVELHHMVYPGKVDVESIRRFLAEHGYAGEQIGWQGRSKYLLAVKT